MQHLTKLSILLPVAAIFGSFFSIANDLALHDALSDFLDDATINKVVDYLDRTNSARTVGFGFVLTLGSAVGVAIDRGVDAAFRVRASSIVPRDSAGE